MVEKEMVEGDVEVVEALAEAKLRLKAGATKP